MNRPFGAAYAGMYDALYAGKNYERECDVVEEAFRRFASRPVREVLDLGCGTGSHAVALASRGYRVVGVDRSAEMIGRAVEKAARAGVAVDFITGDARDLRLPNHFDAALLLFAVLSYLPTDQDVTAALRTARAHLGEGGLILLDVWYGPGVLADPPEERRRIVATPAGDAVRVALPELDVDSRLCRVRYRLELPGTVVEEEDHVVRFFFADELERLLRETGFRLLALTPEWRLDDELEPTTWSVTLVGRAEAG